jgi:hypothetical protein
MLVTALLGSAVTASAAADASAASASPTNGAAQASTSPGSDRALDQASVLQKPAQLTDLSVGVRQSYDHNVFLSGADGKYLPTSHMVPPGGVAALKGFSSWVTTVSARIAVNLTPLPGAENLDRSTAAFAPLQPRERTARRHSRICLPRSLACLTAGSNSRSARFGQGGFLRNSRQ